MTAKPEEDFSPDKRTKTGFYAWCRDCHNENQRNWRSANMTSERKERKRKSDLEDYYKHHEQRREQQIDSRLRNRYGISKDEYDAILLNQDGVCKICREFKPGPKSMHVDHCHSSGKVRGILCSRCNLKVGLIENNRDWIIKADEYLRENG